MIIDFFAKSISWYAQLRVEASCFIKCIKRKVPSFSIRKCVSINFFLMGIIYTVIAIRIRKIEWGAYCVNATLSTMLLFWLFSAEHFTTVIVNQKEYFSDESYSKVYSKYVKWTNGKKLNDADKRVWPHCFIIGFYYAWLVLSGFITHYFCCIDLYSFTPVMKAIDLALLFIVLLLNGNSFFSTGIFTYFLCDLYYEELKNIDKKTGKRISHNAVLPNKTVGIKLLLDDAKAFSTSFLFVALCFTIQLVVCILSSTDRETIFASTGFQVIVAFTILLCFGMYIISTLGARYYIRKLVNLWTKEVLIKLEREMSVMDSSRDARKILQHEQLMNSVRKESVSMIPSGIELVITALGVIVNLIPIILNIIGCHFKIS